MNRRLLGVLILAGLAAALVEFDGTVLYLALPAISADFRAPIGQLANAGSVLALGSVLGLPLAALADRRGRRPGLALAVAGLAIGNLLSGLAPSLFLLALARLLAVTFASVVLNLAIVVVVEEAPPARRGLMVSAVSLCAGGGAGVTSILYPLLAPNWRYLYLAGGLGLVLAGALWRLLPETVIWRAADHAANPLRVLAQRGWRRRLAVIAAVAILSAVAYEPGGIFGGFFGSRYLHFSPFLVSLVLIASAPMALAGYLVGGWFTDRTGRRLPATVLSILSAGLAALTFAGSAGAYWAGELGWSLTASAASPMISAWYAELFPTRARATAQATATFAGAVGAIIGLQLLGLFSPRIGFGPALVWLSASALLGALLLLLLPETRGNPLPE